MIEGNDNMENSLGKLQCQVDKLSQKNMRLEDKNEEYKSKIYHLRKRLEKKDKDIELKIEKAVNKALNKYKSDEIKRLTKENEKLKAKIFKLEQRLNISGETLGRKKDE